MDNNQHLETVLNRYRKSIAMLAGTALAGLVALYAEHSKRPILEEPTSSCEQSLECRYSERIKQKLEQLLE